MRDDYERPPRPSLALWLALVALIAAAVFLYFRSTHDTVETPPPILIPDEVEREPVIRHPLPPMPEPEPEEEAAEETQPPPIAEHLPSPLPALDESDAALSSLAGYLISSPRLAELLVTRNMIRRLVITADSLTGRALPLNHIPTTFPTERFPVVQRGEEIFLDERNYARYGRHVALLDSLDSGDLVRAYVHFYPLLQEAYRDLGYPQGFFNDRLIAVIDHLLETPEVSGPIRLEHPSVFYVYADPRLEALSTGQRLLIRMGPDNAAAVKRKLREIRRELVR